MAEVATAYVTLIPSAKGFGRGIQGQIGPQLRGAGQQGGKTFGAGMQSGVLGMASKVFAPLAAAFAGLKIGQWFGDAISAGSDFQQALGGADSVFKKEAAEIKSAAEDAALSLGLPKNAYLELATVLGASLKNKGIDDFTDQTQQLITIGGDLAATFGGETKDAVDALAAALRGESDPIERYGIALNETAVNAKLVEMGVKKTNGAYTEQEKTLARLSLIQEQSADAQGQFAREADTYAGSQARLAASWENIKTQVGAALLPALTDLSQWFLSDGLPAVQRFGGWVRDELWPALQDGWKRIQPGLERAKEIILGAFGDQTTGSVKTFGDFITDVLVPAIAEFVNVYLPLWASQIASIIEILRGLKNFIIDAANAIIEEFVNVTNFFAAMLEALGKVPGFDWADEAAKKLRNASKEAEVLKNRINGIKGKTIDINVRTNFRSYGTPGYGAGDNLIISGRAKGGPVRAGQPYIVGEKRPELFVPDVNGTIMPRVPSPGTSPSGFAGETRLSPIDAALLRDVAERPSVIAVDGMRVGQAVNRAHAARRPS